MSATASEQLLTKQHHVRPAKRREREFSVTRAAKPGQNQSNAVQAQGNYRVTSSIPIATLLRSPPLTPPETTQIKIPLETDFSTKQVLASSLN